MSCTQLTVEQQPARAELVGACFVEVRDDKDPRVNRYGQPKAFIGLARQKFSVQTRLG